MISRRQRALYASYIHKACRSNYQSASQGPSRARNRIKTCALWYRPGCCDISIYSLAGLLVVDDAMRREGGFAIASAILTLLGPPFHSSRQLSKKLCRVEASRSRAAIGWRHISAVARREKSIFDFNGNASHFSANLWIVAKANIAYNIERAISTHCLTIDCWSESWRG